MNALVALVQSVGSLFVRTSQEDGKKLEVATVPMLLVLYALAGVSCSIQQGEPFSQCFRTVVSAMIPGGE